MSQNALEAFSHSNASSCNFPLLVDGVVVAIHYPSDGDDHRNGYQIVYDVEPVSTPGLATMYNVPYLRFASGYEDGDEVILRVASKSVTGGTKYKSVDENNSGKHCDLLQTDGDRVIVGFLNGKFQNPVILGVLPNANSKVELKDSYGEEFPKDNKLVRRTTHRGTEVMMDDSGNVTVNFAEHPEDSNVADKKTMKVHVGDLDFTIDNATSPSVFQVANKDGGSFILKLDKNHIEIDVPETASIKAGDTATVESTNDATLESTSANVNVKCSPAGGKIYLGGPTLATFAVAMDTDTAGPYPIITSGQVVKARKM